MNILHSYTIYFNASIHTVLTLFIDNRKFKGCVIGGIENNEHSFISAGRRLSLTNLSNRIAYEIVKRTLKPYGKRLNIYEKFGKIIQQKYSIISHLCII